MISESPERLFQRPKGGFGRETSGAQSGDDFRIECPIGTDQDRLSLPHRYEHKAKFLIQPLSQEQIPVKIGHRFLLAVQLERRRLKRFSLSEKQRFHFQLETGVFFPWASSSAGLDGVFISHAGCLGLHGEIWPDHTFLIPLIQATEHRNRQEVAIQNDPEENAWSRTWSRTLAAAKPWFII